MAAVVVGMPVQVLGWGTQGHQVVATMAEAQLTPGAAAQIQRLLNLEPGSTLASISSWADDHRSPAFGRWHYVNFPCDSCTYDKNRDCPDGRCIVEAIKAQTRLLSPLEPDSVKLTALKYLVHLIADIHQPLHAGYADDKGGNTFQIQAFGKGTNLHALWDSGMIRQSGLILAAISTKLLAEPRPAGAEVLDPALIAQESCLIVARKGFYPRLRVSSDDYRDIWWPVLERRLSLASARLAGVLNNELK